MTIPCIYKALKINIRTPLVTVDDLPVTATLVEFMQLLFINAKLVYGSVC